MPTTSDLLARLAEHRDPDAWALLVERHAPAMARVATAVAGPVDADDAVQEALLQVRRAAVKFRGHGDDPERSAVSWLLRITANCALLIKRGEAARHSRERRAGAELPVSAPTDEPTNRELLPALREALAGLTEKQRRPVVLRYFAGCDDQALAAELGCSPGAARVKLHRSMTRLRKRLGALGLVLAPLLLTDRLAAWGAAAAPATAPAPATATAPTITPAALAGWQALITSPAQPLLPAHLVTGGTTVTKLIALAAAAAVLALTVGIATLAAQPAAPAGDAAPAPATAAVLADPATEPAPPVVATDPPPDPEPAPEPLPVIDAATLRRLAVANAVFAVDLYKRLAGQEGNLCLCPHSISTALAMTWGGARGACADEMAKAMRFPFDQAGTHPAFQALAKDLVDRAAAAKAELAVANGICLSGGGVRPEYIAFLKRRYDAELFSGGLDEINGWVKEKTREKIPTILDELSPNSVCVISRPWRRSSTPSILRISSSLCALIKRSLRVISVSSPIIATTSFPPVCRCFRKLAS